MKSYFFLLCLLGCPTVSLAQNAAEHRCHLSVSIRDENGNPTAARVKITTKGSSIRTAPATSLAVMYGVWDHADGFAFQPDSSFYISTDFQIDVAPSLYSISVSKGFEYDRIQTSFDCRRDTAITIRLRRWTDMSRGNWYSADDHIHIRRSPNENPILLDWMKAENLNVGVFLRMGDFWSTYYEQYAWGTAGVFQHGNFMLASGQEDPRTPQFGHALGIAPDEKARYNREYFLYDKVFDEIHKRKGVTGYAHQAESFHGYRGLMLDGMRGRVDALELVQFCVSEEPLKTQHYYHMLNLGFKLTAIAGSDFPWCGRDHHHGRPERNARIGDARFYTYVPEGLTFESWRRALSKGNTFATTGPMLMFKVDNAMAGDSLNVTKGQSVKVNIKAFGSRDTQVSKVELIQFGKVIGSQSTRVGAYADSLALTSQVKIDNGCWLAARCFGRDGMVAHTTPVYVYVGKEGFANKEALEANIKLAQSYLDELKLDIQQVNNDPEKQSWRHKDAIMRRIKEAEAVLQKLQNLSADR